MAHRRAGEKRNDRVSGGLAGVLCHTAVCASRDSSLSIHQAHRAIGPGGDQVSLGLCVASARVQNRAVQHREIVEPVLGDPL